MRWILAVLAIGAAGICQAEALTPQVEIEEEVYRYADAQNGAGPMWCAGSTCLVRSGDQLFASGLEVVPDAKPLNNCRWMLFVRRATGWERVRVDSEGRTREPAPMAAFADGRVYLSVNPAIDAGPQPGGGPTRPDVLKFSAHEPEAPPASVTPRWRERPPFSEHSYRSFAADGASGELVLFQNIGYTHAEWTFFDRGGRWSSQGKLQWPWGAEYETPQPIRVCYPNVALLDRQVHFVGVSDIVEPNQAWREYKRELTGLDWDYDFRRLFYTWTADIAKQPFADWIEISSRDKTCGGISPGDLWLAPSGEAHVVWTERAIDERLRDKFFPGAPQSHSVNYARVRDGRILERRTLLESTEAKPGIIGSAPRFHVTPDHRLFVVYSAKGVEPDGTPVSENRIVEMRADGAVSASARLPLKSPFISYFTTTVRGGSPPSNTLEMLGERAGVPRTISYARVRLLP
ncbi:MAG: hypothetical protein JNL18_08550 [Planctomycetaceae bacterium]|nr:hypothetical protein [Planctomycetaceae bacterium]